MREFKTEAAWQKWVIEEILSIPRTWVFQAPTKTMRGIPDLIACVNGYFVALELKLDKARPDKSRETLQKHTLNKIKVAGSPICVERLTESTWPEVQRKLVFLSQITEPRTPFQNLLPE